ncbi:MAG: tetratricopeptide repeat protein [bacterium]|nr:tetratricopeptide repeat protein [bacterium]
MRRFIATIVPLLLLCALPATAGWEEGVAAFKSKNYQAAADEFGELVKKTPDAWQVWFMHARALGQLKRDAEALHSLRKAYDLNPNELSVKLELGKGYYTARRYSDVVKLFGSVDPSSLPVKQRTSFYQLRAAAREKTDNTDGAVSDYAALAKLNPEDAKIQHKYGSMAVRADDIEQGIRALDRAYKLAPRDAEIKRGYATALIKKGRHSRDKTTKKTSYLRASEVAAELVSLDSSFESVMLKLKAELGAGLYAKAIDTGKSATAKKPGDWEALLYLGQAYTSNGQYAEAIKPLEDALGKASGTDQNTIWSQLGFTYEKQKKYTQSIEAYQKAGNQTAAARVKENQDTEMFNKQVQAENEQIEEMKKEAERLEAELRALEQGGGG